MAVIIPVGFAQSTQQFLLTGGVGPFSVTCGHNVLPGETAETIANEVRSRWSTHVWLPSARPTAYSLGPCRAEFVTAPGVVEVFTNESITPGVSGAFAPLPPNCALLVQKRSGLGGRRNRGRMFLPPIHANEGDVDAIGVINGTTLAVIQGWFDDFFDGLTTAGLEPMIFHSDGGVPTPIVTFACQPKMATQRDRLR